jgi:hypothetical protein
MHCYFDNNNANEEGSDIYHELMETGETYSDFSFIGSCSTRSSSDGFIVNEHEEKSNLLCLCALDPPPYYITNSTNLKPNNNHTCLDAFHPCRTLSGILTRASRYVIVKILNNFTDSNVGVSYVKLHITREDENAVSGIGFGDDEGYLIKTGKFGELYLEIINIYVDNKSKGAYLYIVENGSVNVNSCNITSNDEFSDFAFVKLEHGIIKLYNVLVTNVKFKKASFISINKLDGSSTIDIESSQFNNVVSMISGVIINQTTPSDYQLNIDVYSNEGDTQLFKNIEWSLNDDLPQGGVVFSIFGGKLTEFHVSNTNFTDIKGNSSSSQGGVLYIEKSLQVVFDTVKFYNITEINSGGGIYSDNENNFIYVYNSTFELLEVTRFGGAVYFGKSTRFTINKTSIFSCEAYKGFGVYSISNAPLEEEQKIYVDVEFSNDVINCTDIFDEGSDSLWNFNSLTVINTISTSTSQPKFVLTNGSESEWIFDCLISAGQPCWEEDVIVSQDGFDHVICGRLYFTCKTIFF